MNTPSSHEFAPSSPEFEPVRPPMYYIDYAPNQSVVFSVGPQLTRGSYSEWTFSVPGSPFLAEADRTIYLPNDKDGKPLGINEGDCLSAAEVLKELTASDVRPEGIDFTSLADRGSELETELAKVVDDLLADPELHRRAVDRILDARAAKQLYNSPELSFEIEERNALELPKLIKLLESDHLPKSKPFKTTHIHSLEELHTFNRIKEQQNEPLFPIVHPAYELTPLEGKKFIKSDVEPADIKGILDAIKKGRGPTNIFIDPQDLQQ